MDKKLTHEEERLFELLESKQFEELTDDERTFVLENCGASEYKIQRQLIVEAGKLDDEDHEPLPLLLPVTSATNNKGGIMIPLYQVLIGVAALLIFFFSIWPKNNPELINHAKNEQQRIDTIYQTQLVYDTIVQLIPQIQVVEKIIRDSVMIFMPSTIITEIPRLLDVKPSTALPDLTQANLKNKGKNLKEDDVYLDLLPVGGHFLNNH